MYMPAGDSAPLLDDGSRIAMASEKDSETPSEKAASAAAKILRSPYSSQAEKSAAASVLERRPDARRKK